MGIFERVLQEQPSTEGLALTPRQAFAALVLGAFSSDGQVAPEKTLRVNEIFNSTKLFGRTSGEPTQAVVDHVLELFDRQGFGPVVMAAARQLPDHLRAPAFAIAVDVVMADGQASSKERKFIDGLQGLLNIPDTIAVKIVDVIVTKNSV